MQGRVSDSEPQPIAVVGVVQDSEQTRGWVVADYHFSHVEFRQCNVSLVCLRFAQIKATLMGCPASAPALPCARCLRRS